jgi:ketosteroid isomerase-like protein
MNRLDTMRRLNEAFNAGDQRWTDFYTDDAEFFMPPEWPDEALLVGPAEIDRAARMWGEQLDDYRWDVERLIETPEFVLGLYWHRGRIKGTDQQVEAQVGALFYLEGEKIGKVVSYGTWDAALASAGLADEVTG